jgi:hypothetical protein
LRPCRRSGPRVRVDVARNIDAGFTEGRGIGDLVVTSGTDNQPGAAPAMHGARFRRVQGGLRWGQGTSVHVRGGSGASPNGCRQG